MNSVYIGRRFFQEKENDFRPPELLFPIFLIWWPGAFRFLFTPVLTHLQALAEKKLISRVIKPPNLRRVFFGFQSFICMSGEMMFPRLEGSGHPE